MRAFAVPRFGQPPALHDLAPPVPDGIADVLVRVRCAGVNPIDRKRVDALRAGDSFPHILGIDLAGTVERVQPGDAGGGLTVGDRVFGTARRSGAWAEHALISPRAPGEAIARIPDDVAFEQAAALPVAGLMALGGLRLLDLRPGQTLLVLGAAGGVGGIALQLARDRGVRILATTRDDGDDARRLGADLVFDARADDPLARVVAACPDGVDAALDLVSDADAIRKLTDIVRAGGRVVSALRAADEAAFAARGITAHNMEGARNPSANTEGLAELARAVSDGVLDPRIAFRTDLANAADALARLRDGRLGGKAVLTVGA